MLARRNFKDRYDAGTEISLREFLYPIMQGYDSVAVESDVEVGGFDQLFNLKAGRVMQEYYGQKKQNILTFQMLEGTDGRKMSTSWGNIITIVDEPFDMYGKVMSLRDDLIIKYFTLCTDKTLAEIDEYKARLENGENPKNLKMILAKTLVSQYHDDKQAALAEANFVEVFEKGGVPDVIDEYITNTEDKTLGDCAVNSKVVESKAEWKRLVESGAVTLDEQQVEDFRAEAKSGILKVGKRRFLRIKA
jgi:tyrosyl-tRNA synthetase